MYRKLYAFLAFLLLTAGSAAAQYRPWWQWAVADTGYASPLSQPEHVLAAAGKKALWGRIMNNKLMTGTNVFGDYVLSEYDSAGSVLVNTFIGGKMRLLDAQADGTGNWYILGRFHDSLVFANHTIVTRSPNTPEPDHFIARLNSGNLNLAWVQSIGGNSAARAAAFTIANGQIYLAVDSGKETQVRTLSLFTGAHTVLLRQGGASTTSSIQVDAAQNIYLAGSCGIDGINFAGVQQAPVAGNNAPSYIVRYRANGSHHWHYWMYDNSCVQRKLNLAGNNMLYYSGDLRDSMKIGNVSLLKPVSVNDYVAARLDSNGTVAWARQLDGSGGDVSIGGPYNAVVTPDSALVLFAKTNQYVNWSSTIGTNAGSTYGATVISFGPAGTPRWARIALGQHLTNQHIATDGDAVWITGNGYTNTNFLGFDTLHLNVKPQVYNPYLARLKLTAPPVVSGIGGTYAQLPVQVFPNPATGEVRITGLDGLKEKVMVNLIEVTGKVVLHRELTTGTGNAVIGVAGLPRGAYFLEVRSGGARKVQKLVLW